MIVLAGDSFVYGSELKDTTKTFGCLLASGSAYENISWPGYGNDSIARTTIERCERGGVNSVLVLWTFPGRYEFRFGYDTKQHTGNWYTITPWTTQTEKNIEREFISKDENILYQHSQTVLRAKQTGVSEFAETFYKHVGGTEYWEIYSSLKEIVYLQNYLRVKSIPYMFTCADTSLLYNYTIDLRDPVIMSVFNQIDLDKWFLFPKSENSWETTQPRGFYQWAVENKYPVGTTHPLEQAHQDAAKLMQEKFNELVKKSV